MNAKAHTSMRALVSLGVLAGLLAIAGDTRGDSAPTFAELPVGRLSVPSQRTPGAISARESVPGIFVVPPRYGYGGGRRYVSISADARVAAAQKGGDHWDPSRSMPTGCVAQLHRSRLSFGDGDAGDSEWDENLATEVQAYSKTADNPSSGVMAVHSERIVEQGGVVTLESVDAWVDPATRGARLISKASLPLKLLREPAFGMKVYAGRDERPDGKRFVQFVVIRPEGPHMERTSQVWAMRQEGSLAHSSGCSHQRVAIPLDEASGDTATVIATVLLPAPGASAGEARRGSPPPVAPPPTPNVRTPPRAFLGAAGAGPIPAGFKEVELRTRVMHIQVSLSRTAREKEPLVSVSSSWGGREQVDRVIEPEAAPL